MLNFTHTTNDGARVSVSHVPGGRLDLEVDFNGQATGIYLNYEEVEQFIYGVRAMLRECEYGSARQDS